MFLFSSIIKTEINRLSIIKERSFSLHQSRASCSISKTPGNEYPFHFLSSFLLLPVMGSKHHSFFKRKKSRYHCGNCSNFHDELYLLYVFIVHQFTLFVNRKNQYICLLFSIPLCSYLCLQQRLFSRYHSSCDLINFCASAKVTG